MDNETFYKLAATTIEQLKAENDNLKTQLNRVEESIKLASKLYNSGVIPAEGVFDKIAEFALKSDADLEVLEKAAEFQKVASSLNSFKLSSSTNYETSLDDTEVFFHNLLN